ncbi:MAG: sulfotransferase [Pseudanabaena sp.]|nr:MAG: sulfotransferase [Pseudanabaena sp.]
MINKKIIYISGLPFAGGSILAQLFSQHPDIFSIGETSALCSTLIGLRQQLSDNHILLNQLERNFHLTYQRILNANWGLINGWFKETSKPWVVDQNSDWLRHIETLYTLDSDFKMLICVRELGQILGEIENQHQKTILLDFPEHTAHLPRRERANQGFGENGLLGESMRSLLNIQDIDPALHDHLYYVVYEHLISDPEQVMTQIWQWLGLPSVKLDLELFPVSEKSTSSHRFKYPQQNLYNSEASNVYPISASLDQALKQTYFWFYKTFYPAKA